MSEPTYDELMHMADRLALDLQEYVDEGVRGGSEMEASLLLLEEFQDLKFRDGRIWQQVCTKNENNKSSLIDEL